MAIWPAVGQRLAECFIEKTVAEAVEVKAYWETGVNISKQKDTVSVKEGKEIVTAANPKAIAGALATYAAEL